MPDFDILYSPTPILFVGRVQPFRVARRFLFPQASYVCVAL